MEDQVLDAEQFGYNDNGLRRRLLLPVWIKIFLWIFLVFGIMVPVVIILGIFGTHQELSLYSFETDQPFSLMGVCLTALFLIKGLTSFGLWTEKDWAVNLAIVDAVIGIVLCVFVMLVLPFISDNHGFNIRLELIVLIPYLIKMKSIRSEWSNRPGLSKHS